MPYQPARNLPQEIQHYPDAVMTFSEIAAVLGVSQAAVFQTYQAAMRKLTRGERLQQLRVIREQLLVDRHGR